MHPTRLVVARAPRPIFTEADGLDLIVRNALRLEVARHRLRAPLTELVVVRFGAALIRVALDLDAQTLVVLQAARRLVELAFGLVGDLRRVEGEVNPDRRAGG